ncbi:MAG: LPS export ABC transporter periplasmic protein LptC [bacterium]
MAGLIKRNRPALFVVMGILIPVLIFFYISGNGQFRKKGDGTQASKNRADLSIQKFHFTERGSGEQKWEIWAERAERFLDRSQVHMDQVRVEYPMSEGGWVHLSGLLGDYFEKEKRVELSGNVQVVTDSGYTLYADRLVWEKDKNLISSEKPVRLVTAGYMVSGDRMTFRTDLRKVELIGGIKTVITPGAQAEGKKP